MQGPETSKSPPRKRARASPASEDPHCLEKDEEFWYDDGTIILITGNIEFRVYRGPLAKHSPIFHDMLALPQPPISDSTPSSFEESVLGPPCPAVHVTDSPTDLRHFLRAFVPGEIPMCAKLSIYLRSAALAHNLLDTCRPMEAPKFDAVSAWIRLGHKYEVDKLVENGLQYLRRFYPTFLSHSRRSCPGPIKRDRPADLQREAAIAIVNLARLTGSDDLLPLALLECCKLNANIVNGYAREDGTAEYLSQDDIGRCFAAKGVLAMQVIAAYLAIFERADTDPGCLDADACQDVLRNSAENFRTMDLNFNIEVDELLKYQQAELFVVDTDALCLRCRPGVRELVEEQRKEFWDALPRWFNISVDG